MEALGAYTSCFRGQTQFQAHILRGLCSVDVNGVEYWPAHSNRGTRREGVGTLTARCVVPPARHGDPLSLTGAGVVLQPVAGGLHGAPIDAGIKQAVLVEEGGVHFAVTLGEAGVLVGDQAAQLLHLGEPFHLGAGGAAVPAANLAEGVPLHPALPKLIDAGSKQTHGHLQVILGVAVIAATQAVRAILHAPGDRDRQEALPVVHDLEAELCLHHHVEAEGKDIYFPLSQLQGQIQAFVVDLQERELAVEKSGWPREHPLLLTIGLESGSPRGGLSRLNVILASGVVYVSQLLLLGSKQT